jgi:hypothetical protein
VVIRPAVRTRSVAVGERRDDEVAGGEGLDVIADLFDDTDELVTDGAVGGKSWRRASTTGQTRRRTPTRRARRISRLKDGRVGPFADLDIARSLEDCGFHGWFSFDWLSGR